MVFMITVGWRRNRNGFFILLMKRNDFVIDIAKGDVIDNIIVFKEDIINWR